MPRAARLLVVVAAVVGAAVACPPVPDVARSPHDLAVRLRFKASCGEFSATTYDTSCLGALRLEAFDDTGEIVGRGCQSYDEDTAPRTLADVIFSDEIGTAITNLDVDARVGVRVIGMQPLAADPCTSPQSGEALFWGESPPRVLGDVGVDGGAPVIDVPIECRDCEQACDAGTCRGCVAIAEGNCPVTRPLGFCIPDDGLCGRLCGADDDCFEGLMRCNLTTHRCEPRSDVGGLCTPCDVDDAGNVDECVAPYTCVGTSPTSKRGFCAPPCVDFTPCARGAKCNDIEHDLFLVGEVSVSSVDAGFVDAGALDAGVDP